MIISEEMHGRQFEWAGQEFSLPILHYYLTGLEKKCPAICPVPLPVVRMELLPIYDFTQIRQIPYFHTLYLFKYGFVIMDPCDKSY